MNNRLKTADLNRFPVTPRRGYSCHYHFITFIKLDDHMNDHRPLKTTMLSESLMKETFIGDKRRAGLSFAGVYDWQGIKRYRFNAADSKDVQATMSRIYWTIEISQFIPNKLLGEMDHDFFTS